MDAHAGADEELISYITSRGGQIQALEGELATAKAAQQQAAQQLAVRNAELTGLRAELASLRRVKEAEVHGLGDKAQRLGRQLDEEVGKARRLEVQLSRAQDERAEARAQASALERRLADVERSSNTQLGLLRHAAAALEQRLAAAQAEAAAREQQVRGALRSEQQRREREGAAAEAAAAQLGEAQAQCARLAARLGDAEMAAARAEARTQAAEAAAAAGAAAAEGGGQLRALHDQLRRLRQDACGSQRNDQKVEELEQRLMLAEERARCSEAAVQQLPETESKLGAAERELSQWRMLFKKATGMDTPSPAAVGRLQGELLRAQQGLAEARAEVESLRAEQARLAQAAEAAEARGAAAAADAEARGRLLAVTSARLAAAAAERDSAVAQLALVDAELASLRQESAAAAGFDATAQQLQEGEQAAEREAERAAQQDAQRQAYEVAGGRVKAAEAMAAEVRRQLSILEAAAEEAVAGEAAARRRADAAEEVAAGLERELGELGREVERLQSRLGSGEYDGSATKVLHLAANPEREVERLEAQTRLEQLAAENEALREQVGRLDAAAAAAAGGGGGAGGAVGGGDSGGGGCSLALAVKDAEVMVLRRRLAEAEKGLARLKDVFRARVAAFREACATLFGYRVDMVSEPAKDLDSAPTTYVLRPVLPSASAAPGSGPLAGIEPEQQHLLFRYTPKAGMELVPGGLSGRLCREVDMFVVRCSCIAALTANLTMELFQLSTTA